MRIVSDFDLIVDAGLAIDFGYYGDYNHYYTHAMCTGYDPILAALRTGKFYLPIGVRRLSSLLRFDVESGYSEAFASNPVLAYTHDDNYDRATYANKLAGLGLFLDTLSGVGHRIPSFEGEKHCRHVTTRGTVYPRCSDIPHNKLDYNFCGTNIPTRFNQGNTYYHVRVMGLNPLVVEPIPIYFGDYFGRNLLDFLAGIPKPFSYNRYDHGLQVVRLSQLDFRMDCGSMVIEYNVEVETFPSLLNNYNDDHTWWHVCVSLPCDLQTGSFVPSVSGVYSTTRWQQGTYEYSDFRSNYGGGFPEYGPTTYKNVSVGDQRMFPIFLTIPSYEGEGDVNGVSSFLNGDVLHNFQLRVERDWRHVTPAALFSSAAAVKDMEHSLGVNILQNLQKLPDIASMMPAIKDAIKVLGRVVKRDLSLATLRDIFSLISQTELQRSFQWRPSFDVLTKYLPQLLATIRLLGKTSDRSVGYGSYAFTFPVGSFGRAESHLVCRTKLVVDTSHTGILSALLGQDALGILPKVSNLWDLVPFSFAVNWFTGIGGSIRRAEYSVMLSALPAYYVHTYTIESPLTSDELSLYGFSSSISDPAVLRLYYRDISLFSPAVSDSKFGFGIPTELPPIGTVASLFWQLFFAAK
jgi:hypothetical protein